MSGDSVDRDGGPGDEPVELGIDDALALGRDLHRAGRLEEAESIYRQVLDQAGEHPGVLNLLAILSHQRGRLADAQDFIERAIAVSPGNADLHNNLGNLLKLSGRTEAAAAAYQRAIAIDPAHADAFNNLGVILRQSGRIDESLAAYRKAIELNPRFLDALHNLGSLLSGQGELTEAVAIFRRAVEVDGDSPNAALDLAGALHRLGRSDEAADDYRRVLTIDPQNAIARHMLAVCTGQDVPDRAPDCYVQALFGRLAADFDQHLGALDYRAPALVAEALASHLPRPARQFDVLDAGSGTGLCGPLLRPYARHLTGVDLSPEMSSRAGDRGYDELVVAELAGFMRQHPASYDLVVSADTLNYFGALDEVLRSAADSLRREGRLVFTLERDEDEALPNGFRVGRSGRYCHDRDYVRRCLEGAGLTVEAVLDVDLRLELGRPVPGMLVIAARSAVGPVGE